MIAPGTDKAKAAFDKALPILKIGLAGEKALMAYTSKHPLSNDAEDKESSNLHSSVTKQNEPHKHSLPKINHSRRLQNYQKAQTLRLSHPNYATMQKFRATLPAHNHAKSVCDSIISHPVVIISGDTGCGKSTQIPQFLLDDDRIGPSCNIIITQPRRISAISVAERVAAERNECIDDDSKNCLVGYNVRLDSKCSSNTKLLFLTPGVLLRKLSNNQGLEGVTHVIIDEVHERDKYTDFLMICLRDILQKKPNSIKVILMSATLQTNVLLDYWRVLVENPEGGEMLMQVPPEIYIPGRAYPVQEFFLEDLLAMTGFVDDLVMMGGAGGGGAGVVMAHDMVQLENELADLLKNKSTIHKQNQRRNCNNNKNSTSNDSSKDNTLTCVMCNASGFRCPEELGSHVAMCTGDGNVSMEDLEERIRNMPATNPLLGGYDDTTTVEEEEENEDNNDNEYYSDDDDVDAKPDMLWDGLSPFEDVSLVNAHHRSTLTEEELLRRYQASHDDELIDDMLLLETLKYIIQSSYGDGSILIFFPGWMEISEFNLLLDSTPPFHDKTRYSVLPLHSGIPSKDQRKVFSRPSKGVRKIVLATNIAETSVTIDDVTFVVDTGRAKEKSYDPHLKTSTLTPVWISQASTKQRKGRAGRTKPGVCFRLFSRRRYSSFRPFLESELLRTPLEEMCLQCKQLELAPGGPTDVDGIPAFLSKAMSPPHPKSISNALELLVELGAMGEKTNNLTDLGRCLSRLSLEPRVGKMLIWSYLLGCSNMAVSMGVSMSYKSPFSLPPVSLRRNADMAKIQLSERSESDQITILNALRARDTIMNNRRGAGGMGALNGFCRSNYISISTLQMIAELRKNACRELLSCGFPSPNDSRGYHNRNATKGGGNSYNACVDPAFLQAAITAGLYPNVASRQDGDVNFATMTNRKAKVHISSVNSIRGQPLSQKCGIKKGVEFIVFGEMVRGVNFFTMSQTTHLSSPVPLLLLCGEMKVRPAFVFTSSADGDDDGIDGSKKKINDTMNSMAVLSVDDWIVFQCEASIATSLVLLRRRLDSAFLHLVGNPSAGLDSLQETEKSALEVLSVVLKSAHHAMSHR